MSTDANSGRLTARLHATPLQARIAPGGFDEALQRRIDCARRAGIEEGRSADRDSAARALAQACERLDEARAAAAEQIARTSVELGVEIARTLIRAEIDSGRLGLEAIVRDALAASGVGRAACVVHLNPLDAATLANVKFRAGTTIEPDESVARADVHVSTPQGLLVREMGEALRAVRQRLLEEFAP